MAARCRSVWTLKKHYPKVKVYTRAYDVDHGLSLEKVCLRTGSLLQIPAFQACIQQILPAVQCFILCVYLHA